MAGKSRNTPREDITGQRFGKLIAVDFISHAAENGTRGLWICKCDCGGECRAGANSLKCGNVASCGCIKTANLEELNVRRAIQEHRSDQKSGMLRHFKSYKRSAKTKRREFAITFEQFESIVIRNCYYCGRQPEQRIAKLPGGLQKKFIAHGIDRVDSSVGYVIDNCQPCCTVCNRMKMDMSLSDFISAVGLIYNTHLLGTDDPT